MGRSPILLVRCQNCRKLNNDLILRKQGSCKCGSNRFNGGSPVGLKENLLCWWWALTLGD